MTENIQWLNSESKATLKTLVSKDEVNKAIK
jgi:hypothetical protein